MWGGNWYRGGWGGNGFWTGAMVGMGVGAMTSNWFRPAVVGVPVVQTMGMYDYFPTWSVGAYDTWGLGTVAGETIYSDYTNPYNAAVAGAQPAGGYDYSQPINVAADPPAPDVAETSDQVFAAARDAFKSGDYGRALSLTDEVLKTTPDVPVIHEFRALSLFALGRFDEAASVVYAVLSAGPGWNWETLVGLYPDVETYTNQQRALEAVVKAKTGDPATHFLLAYHYMVQDHKAAAAAQFQEVLKLAPDDALAASFVKVLNKAQEVAAAPAEAAPPAATTAPAATAAASPPPADGAAEAEADHPPPPPANLLGKWTAKPSADLTITLNLEKDGVFSWEVDSKGDKQTLTGMAGYKDDTLGLFQEQGPPLAGKVSEVGPDSFTFGPADGSKGPSLTFKR
jgi:tetratricopeptide (TPR) repeat protein